MNKAVKCSTVLILFSATTAATVREYCQISVGIYSEQIDNAILQT
jgi:hypothetical protein